MRKSRRCLAIVTVVICAALTMAGCGRSSATSGSAQGSANHPKVVPGFNGKTISLGLISVQSGPAAVIGIPWTNGNLAYIDHVNAQGGIDGRYKIKPIVVDSALETSQAVQEFNDLEPKVVMFGNLLGTVVTQAIVPQLDRDGAVGVAGSEDSTWVHQPNLAPWYAPYQIEAINGLEWYHRGLGAGKKICTAYQNDSYGQAAQSGAQFVAKANGFPLAQSVSFASTATDFTSEIAALRSANCGAVLVATLPTTAAAMMSKAASEGFAPEWIDMITSWNAAIATSALKSYVTQHLVVVGDGPEWGDAAVPGMKQMLADQAAYFPKQSPSLFFEQGYVQSEVAVQVLQRAVEKGDLSHAGIQAALRSLSGVSFGGLTGDYTYGPAADRSPPRVNTIFKVDPSGPNGLATLQMGVNSTAAKDFTFGG
jgi:ABC-type branched-subunit amino acid transport system substrate-binding protein